jgi:hypothetical protein
MDKLLAAVEELNQAKAAWDNYQATYYQSYQLDDPITPGERRADEQMRRYEQKIRDRLIKAREEVIAEAQRLQISGKKPGN